MNTFLNNTLQLAQADGTPPSGWVWTLAISFAAICIIMMLVVLIQKPKGGGLSGAFGGGAGGGSTQAVIGARVGDVLTWTTVVCFILFLSLAMGMTWLIKGGPLPSDDEDADEQTESIVDGEAPPITTDEAEIAGEPERIAEPEPDTGIEPAREPDIDATPPAPGAAPAADPAIPSVTEPGIAPPPTAGEAPAAP